jgi:hypothetical protein
MISSPDMAGVGGKRDRDIGGEMEERRKIRMGRKGTRSVPARNKQRNRHDYKVESLVV